MQDKGVFHGCCGGSDHRMSLPADGAAGSMLQHTESVEQFHALRVQTGFRPWDSAMEINLASSIRSFGI